MPAYSTCALVLRKTKLGESDTIVTMLTREGAQHQVMRVRDDRATRETGVLR